ncbi:MAG: iron ABC transporter permease [Dermatophilaceae bacterium]
MSPATPRGRRRRWRPSAGAAAMAAVVAVPVAFLGVFVILPLTGMLARGLLVDGGVDLGGFAEVFGRSRTHRVLGFTFGMATAATVLTVVLGVPVAHLLYATAVPGRRALRSLVTLPFVMPTVVVGVAFRSLLSAGGPLGGLGLDGHPVAVLAAYVFFNLAVVVRTVGSAWQGLDVRAEQCAAALGAAPFTVFRTVTLPALTPAILSAASVVFLFCATAFGVVLTLGSVQYGTVETEIYLLTTQLLDLRSAAVLSLVQLLAVVAMLAVAASLRRGGDSVTRRPAAPTRPAPPTRRAVPSALVTALVVAFLLAPMLALVTRSLRRSQQWSLDNYRSLGAVSADSVLTVPVWQALANSWTTAAVATTLAMILGLAVVVVVSRRPRSTPGRRLIAALDGAFMLPLGISAVTIGFGFLITLDRPPLDLRSSPALVPIAQAMVALPLVVRTLVPVVRGIDDRQRQAAATLGASPARTLLDVDLPTLRRPLVAAVGFALAVSLGEFGATGFLARPDRPTLPVAVYELIGRPGAANFGTALAASVVLAVVTGVVMALVEGLQADRSGAC